MFSVSLLPLSTAWMAVSELAPSRFSFYAAVFFLVNATYIFLIWELIDRHPVHGRTAEGAQDHDSVRSIATLCLFGAAAVVALKYPLVGLGTCVCLLGCLSKTGGSRERRLSPLRSRRPTRLIDPRSEAA